MGLSKLIALGHELKPGLCFTERNIRRIYLFEMPVYVCGKHMWKELVERTYGYRLIDYTPRRRRYSIMEIVMDPDPRKIPIIL